MRVERLGDAPIIGPDTHPSIGTNIQGPSLIRVPEWVESPLGRYYLYFADHKGAYIRLAFSDEITGPWSVHPPGALQLEHSCFPTEPPEADDAEVERLRAGYEELLGADHMPPDFLADATTPHIASPDVHVVGRELRMYFHGLDGLVTQVSRVATSTDGRSFRARPEVLGLSYLRAFDYDGFTYALTMPGHFIRSRDGLTSFEPGPQLFEKDMRHSALLRRDDVLHVFWSRVGDAPERILCSTIDLRSDWMDWQESDSVEVLRPEHSWEGADRPVEPSRRSAVWEPVNQLRDPAIYEEDGRVFLLYAVAGESGIALAEVHLD